MLYQKKRFQNKVATSSFLLPVTAVLCLLLWMAGDISKTTPNENFLFDFSSQQSIGMIPLSFSLGLVLCGICAVLMLELNNRYMLLRIRSRMVSTTLIALWGCMHFLHPFQTGQVVVVCMLIIYHTLFRSYQQMQPVGALFQAFVCLGIGSLFFPPLLLFSPFLFIAFACFQSLCIRSFFAGLMGMLTVFWLVLSWVFVTDRTDWGLQVAQKAVEYPQLFAYEMIDSHQWCSLGLLLLFSIISIIHFLRTNYQDKIRVRMYYYFLVWMELLWVVVIFVLPVYFNIILLLLVMNSSPLIAHFFALTNNRLTNIVFVVFLILLFLLALYNLWMPLYNFF